MLGPLPPPFQDMNIFENSEEYKFSAQTVVGEGHLSASIFPFIILRLSFFFPAQPFPARFNFHAYSVAPHETCLALLPSGLWVFSPSSKPSFSPWKIFARNANSFLNEVCFWVCVCVEESASHIDQDTTTYKTLALATNVGLPWACQGGMWPLFVHSSLET